MKKTEMLLASALALPAAADSKADVIPTHDETDPRFQCTEIAPDIHRCDVPQALANSTHHKIVFLDNNGNPVNKPVDYESFDEGELYPGAACNDYEFQAIWGIENYPSGTFVDNSDIENAVRCDYRHDGEVRMVGGVESSDPVEPPTEEQEEGPDWIFRSGGELGKLPKSNTREPDGQDPFPFTSNGLPMEIAVSEDEISFPDDVRLRTICEETDENGNTVRKVIASQRGMLPMEETVTPPAGQDCEVTITRIPDPSVREAYRNDRNAINAIFDDAKAGCKVGKPELVKEHDALKTTIQYKKGEIQNIKAETEPHIAERDSLVDKRAPYLAERKGLFDQKKALQEQIKECQDKACKAEKKEERKAIQEQIVVLNQQIGQINEEIDAINAIIRPLNDQIALHRAEITNANAIKKEVQQALAAIRECVRTANETRRNELEAAWIDHNGEPLPYTVEFSGYGAMPPGLGKQPEPENEY
jgi:hypothetical protein